jgi:hypothetical protein
MASKATTVTRQTTPANKKRYCALQIDGGDSLTADICTYRIKNCSVHKKPEREQLVALKFRKF